MAHGRRVHVHAGACLGAGCPRHGLAGDQPRAHAARHGQYDEHGHGQRPLACGQRPLAGDQVHEREDLEGMPRMGAHEGERREDQGHRDDDRQFDLAAGTDRAAQILHSVRLQFRIDVGQDSFLLSSMTAEPMEAVPPSMRQGLRHG